VFILNKKLMATFILEKLAFGDIEDLKSPPSGITAFLNVADNVKVSKLPKKYYKVPLKDGVPIPARKLKKIINWIKEKITSDRILIFCKHGKGRSPSVVIGFLCSIGFNYKEAVNFIVSKNSDIKPLPLLAKTIKRMLED